MATDIIKIGGRIEFVNTDDNHRVTYYAGNFPSMEFSPDSNVVNGGIINIYGNSNKRIDDISQINSINDGAVVPVPADMQGLYDLLSVYFESASSSGGGASSPSELETGWVRDDTGVIHWLEISINETSGAKSYSYFDAPEGTATTPSGTVKPATETETNNATVNAGEVNLTTADTVILPSNATRKYAEITNVSSLLAVPPDTGEIIQVEYETSPGSGVFNGITEIHPRGVHPIDVFLGSVRVKMTQGTGRLKFYEV